MEEEIVITLHAEGELFRERITHGEYLAIKAILDIEMHNHTRIVENELNLEEHGQD